MLLHIASHMNIWACISSGETLSASSPRLQQVEAGYTHLQVMRKSTSEKEQKTRLHAAVTWHHCAENFGTRPCRTNWILGQSRVLLQGY